MDKAVGEATILTLRLAHLRANDATNKGWHHVAVQNYLLCFEAMSERGDERARCFFAERLAESYRAMGLFEKAKYYRRFR